VLTDVGTIVTYDTNVETYVSTELSQTVSTVRTVIVVVQIEVGIEIGAIETGSLTVLGTKYVGTTMTVSSTV
jgi:hypothetical protein